MTPAAVSHQIKTLEDWLGVTLFRRLTRALRLTEAGQALLPGVHAGFENLAAAVEKVARQEESGRLTVSVAPSFAAKWLLPRLESFRAEHPDIDVRIDGNMALVDFERDEVDVAIRYGSGDYPGLQVDPLGCCDILLPAFSPSLQEGAHPIREPDDMRYHTLLHADWARPDSEPDWAMWLRAAGVTGVDATRGLTFNDDATAIQAAINGLGVVLASRSLIADDVAAGRLVAPFDVSLRLEFGYWLVAPELHARRRRVCAFRDWILAATKAESAAA